MIRNRQTTVSREGWYYLLVLALVLAGAMLREVNLLLVLGGMLAGPVLLNWKTVRSTLRGLDVRRQVPRGVCAGDLLVTRLHLRNTRRRIGSWAVVVQEQIRRETAGSGDNDRPQPPICPSVLFSYVPAGESLSGVYRGRLPRRGRYRLGPLQLSTRFPFGLFCRTITVDATDTLTVYPRLGRLTGAWFARPRRSLAGTQRHQRRGGPEGDFYGVRPWRTGDCQRWIHWRTSARTAELVVRQLEQPRNRDVAVLVDLWQPTSPTPQHRENVELAVSFAASVVADLCRKGGTNLLVATADPTPQCTVGPVSTPLLEEVMRQLALVEAQATDHLPELLGQALQRTEPGTEIVLITTRAVDLDDRQRFAMLWSDPTRRALIGHIRCIDASSDALAEYFEPQ